MTVQETRSGMSSESCLNYRNERKKGAKMRRYGTEWPFYCQWKFSTVDMQISHQSLSGRSLDFLPIIRIFFDTPPINQPGPDLCKEMNKLLFLQFPSIHSQVEAVETIKDSKWNELWPPWHPSQRSHSPNSFLSWKPKIRLRKQTYFIKHLAPANSATHLMSELILIWWDQLMWRVQQVSDTHDNGP